MSAWPILTAITFLPLVGALFILVVRGDDQVAVRNMRWTALFTTLITFLLSLILWADFDPASRASNSSSNIRWLGGCHDLPYGGGRHFDALRAPDHLPDADLHPGELARSSGASRNI